MATPFPDLRDFYDPAITLPVNGKEYRIAPPSQAVVLNVTGIVAGRDVSDDEYLDAIFSILGAARDEDGIFAGGLVDEMTADGLTWPDLRHIAETAALHYGGDPVRARAWWSRELLNEAVEAQLAKEAAAAAETAKPAAPKRAPRKTATGRKAK